MRTRAIRLGIGVVGVGLVFGGGPSGCAPKAPPSFDSPEPAARTAAVVRAARTTDRRALPDLVRSLRSDDPATRVLAIRALERMTGTTRGYDATGPEHERDEAIARWEAHLRGEGE